IREGNGGGKPLTDRDRREIIKNARRVLSADPHPEAEFTPTPFPSAGDDRGAVDGAFTPAGGARPLRLQVRQPAPGRYRATGSIVQSSYGIKPYTGFFGALKVRDAVDFEAEVEVPSPADPPG